MRLRFVIEDKLEGTVTKELGTQVGVEVGHGVFIGTDGGEFVVEHHMVLGCDGTCSRVEHQGDSAGMLGAKAHEDFTVGPGRPAGKLLAIREGLVQHVNWTPPHMEVTKLGLGPTSFEKEIMGAESCGRAGHMVVQEHGMLNSHGPQGQVSHVRPMYGCMQHHGSGDTHDGLDRPLCHTIVMVGSHTSEPADLGELA